jgi:HAE1 family hydrophobic/amphiphilic exporter-1
MMSARSIDPSHGLAVTLAVLGLSLGLAGAVGAADPAPEESLYVSQFAVATTGDLAPDAEIVREGRPLSIEEAVALAIRNNLDVEVERYAPAIAEADSEGAWGAYDPLLSSDMGYDVAKSPNTFGLNQATINRDSVTGGGIGLDQLVPYVGANVGLRYEASSRTTRNTIQAFDPQYDASLFLTARVPLARGLIWNQAWTNVKVSELQSESSREGFRSSVMDTVRSTVDAYWNLVAARDQVRVAQKSLETARALLEQTQTQYEVGVVSRVEVVEAEAGVADRELGVIQAANAYRNAQDTVIDAVLGRELGALTDLHFAPSDDPASYEVRKVDVGRSVELAFSQRPELRQADREIDQGEVDLRFAKNQRLPQMDVEAGFGYVGISGDGNVGLNPAFGPPPADRSFGDAHDDWFSSDGSENYRVQGVFSIPFPNTTARKRVVRSRLDLQRSKTRRARLEQTIILEVRRAARTLEASAQGIEAAERRRLAAEEQLRAERIRLEHGESTPFEVLQRESDLVEAESQKIGALQAYRSAEIGLERAQGTILDFHDVVLEEAARVELEPDPGGPLGFFSGTGSKAEAPERAR